MLTVGAIGTLWNYDSGSNVQKNNRFNEQNKHPKSTGMLKNLTSTSWSVCNKEETKVHSLTPIFCL